MLSTIIKIFFLFPFLYFIGVFIKAVYMTGGFFPTFLVILSIGIFILYIRLYAQAMQTPENKNTMSKRNKKEEKEANEWGIIDYFDKDE